MSKYRASNGVASASGEDITMSVWVEFADREGRPRSREDALKLVLDRISPDEGKVISPVLIVLLSGDRYQVQRADRKLIKLKRR